MAESVAPLRRRPFDAFLVLWFCVFSVSSFVFEQFIVFDVDLASATDPFGRTWYWYASSFDPVFLDTPLWLRIMCGIDGYVFGACYPVFIYAFAKGRDWVRIPALCYGAAIVYSTLVYFGWEFLDAENRAQANLAMVIVVNIPYTIVPLLLMWRVRDSIDSRATEPPDACLIPRARPATPARRASRRSASGPFRTSAAGPRPPSPPRAGSPSGPGWRVGGRSNPR